MTTTRIVEVRAGVLKKNDELACAADNPSSESVTPPTKPFTDETETAYDATPPAAADTDAGATVSPKSASGETTSVALTVCVSEPLVPVIVIG